MPTKSIPFLLEIATKLYKKHGHGVQNLTCIFPNERSGNIFLHHLAQHFSRPLWAPQVLSLSRFAQMASGLQTAKPITLLAKLYETLEKFQSNKETFERFYSWGYSLVQDLDMVDQYLVDPEKLFSSLRAHKMLTTDLNHLTATQQKVVQEFWSQIANKPLLHKNSSKELYDLLYKLYTAYKKRLLEQGIGYPGLQYNTISKQLKQGISIVDSTGLVCIGLQGITPLEQKMWTQLHEQVPVSFYWDTDAYYMVQNHQEAGHALRSYQDHPLLGANLNPPFARQLFNTTQDITLIASPTTSGQAQIVGQHLRSLMTQPGFAPEQTVIVLPDERLLLPIMHVLPPECTLNITMGYSLAYTPLYHLLEQVMMLQYSLSSHANPPKQVLRQHLNSLFIHPYLKHQDDDLFQHIVDHNPLQALAKAQQKIPYQILFQPVPTQTNFWKHLLSCIQCIEEHLPSKDPVPHPLTQESLTYAKQLCTTLQQATKARPQTITRDTMKLFVHAAQQTRIPLRGNTKQGIQIMSVLETRNLDFAYIFMLSMNEGNFPPTNRAGSLIPYSLRKSYNLPTLENHQATYAYTFYRLLQRSKSAYFIYQKNTTSFQASREMSRYLWQLRYEAPVPIQYQTAVYSLPSSDNAGPPTITKNARVLQALHRFLSTQDSTSGPCLTPSAIKTYLSCKLRFYFTYIAQLSIKAVPQDTVDPTLFGRLLHQTLEILYQPYTGSMMTKDVLKKCKRQAATATHKAFQQTLSHNEQPGHYSLVAQVIQQIAQRLLTLDIAHAPFELLGIELGKRDKPLRTLLKLDQDRTVRLGGIIDRVDKKQDHIRVLDYKTSTFTSRVSSITDLFDTQVSRHNFPALQAIWYAWLFHRTTHPTLHVMPGIISTRHLFEVDFDPGLWVKKQGNQYNPIQSVKAYDEIFETGLRNLLKEIFDPKISFSPTPDQQKCIQCPYKTICQRG